MPFFGFDLSHCNNLTYNHDFSLHFSRENL